MIKSEEMVTQHNTTQYAANSASERFRNGNDSIMQASL